MKTRRGPRGAAHKQESPGDFPKWTASRAWRLTQRSLPSFRKAEMKVHHARRQGIASRGCRGSFICCTAALNAHRRESSLRLAMPEINRQTNLTKVGRRPQPGFAMVR